MNFTNSLHITLLITLACTPLMHTPVARADTGRIILGLVTSTGLAVLGLIGFKAIAENAKTNRILADKKALNDVKNINPVEEFSELALSVDASTLSAEQLTTQLTQNNVGVDQYFDKIKRYKSLLEQALNNLDTHIDYWENDTEHQELREAALKIKNDKELQKKIVLCNELYDVFANTQTRSWMNLDQMVQWIGKRNYNSISGDFELLERHKQIVADARTLENALKRVPGNSQLHQEARNILAWLDQERKMLENNTHYKMQREMYKVAELEKERLKLEKRRVEAEERQAKALEDKVRLTKQNYEEQIQQLITTKNRLNKELLESKERYNNLIVELRELELERQLLQKTIKDLQKNQVNTTINQENKNKIEKLQKELEVLTEKIETLKKKLKNPPYNPQSDAYKEWLENQIKSL